MLSFPGLPATEVSDARSAILLESAVIKFYYLQWLKCMFNLYQL